MKVAVIGTGYVGLVQGACLAHLGHNVWCVDINAERVAQLKRGQVPFFEEGLPELVTQGMQSGRLRFTTDHAQITSEGMPSVVFLCVPTPYRQDGSCDLSYIEKASRDLGKILDASAILVVKSTLPPGTNKRIQEWLGREDIEVASNPEFLRQGIAVEDFLKPQRILIGADSVRAQNALVELHRNIEAPVFIVSPETAQLAKYAANTMLASRLSLMNEIANIADCVGADIKDVEQIVGSDPRIGKKFLRAGAGFGGSCFPKDVLALEYTARQHGYTPRLIQPIIELNRDQPLRFVELIKRRLNGVSGKRLGVWGLAFNKNTDDVRESPALAIANALLNAGATLTVFDPCAMASARRELGDRVEYASSALNAANDAEALLVLTEWDEFAHAPWAQVIGYLRAPIVFDGKNFLPHAQLRGHGFSVHGIGLWQAPSDQV